MKKFCPGRAAPSRRPSIFACKPRFLEANSVRITFILQGLLFPSKIARQMQKYFLAIAPITAKIAVFG